MYFSFSPNPFYYKFCLYTLFLPQYLYHIEVKGTLPTLNQQLNQELSHEISFLHPKLSYKQINQLYNTFKQKHKNQLDYLNIYQKGSILHVEYTPASHNQETVLKYQDYIAKKDGVISKIDVQQGNVLVKINQYVKKGDILISHQIEDTSKKSKLFQHLEELKLIRIKP